MSTRRHNKDHQKKHADNCAVTQELGVPPVPDDPMQFWVQHPTYNILVDLTIFADGETKEVGTDSWCGSYSGRPLLIRQLAPAIKANVLGLSPSTVKNIINALRMWWRLFDHVEKAAEQAGQIVFRVEDVRQLTRIHCDYACRNGMYRHIFNAFVAIANASLKEIGAPVLYWDSPVNPKVNRHLPSEVETAALRVELKQVWAAVRRRWALMDSMRDTNFVPQTEEEVCLLKHWNYFNKQQRKYGVTLPTSEQIRDGLSFSQFARKTHLTLSTLRETVFPTTWDAHTAFHMCLANTGWNPAVLATLDVRFEESFLRNHPQDESRYILIGTKTRGGGKEQFVGGLWKTPWGPGPIIRAWLERVAPIRELLQAEIIVERERYYTLFQSGASHDELARQHVAVQRLERGIRSVWLFVGGTGNIGWIDANYENYYIDSKKVSYLCWLICKLNEKRTLLREPPVGVIKASDFRDIFAMYIWRQSGSNILAVMRLLTHTQLQTTQRYLDNNILNAERDKKARTFLDDLFYELGQGRLDITILAHRQRFGSVTPEMEKRLYDFRALELSRLSIGCNNPFNPPIAIQPNADGIKRCGQQRCLLCNEGVILPESLDGIAMRVEELRAIQRTISMEVWFTSDFSQELMNGLNALKLFPVVDVHAALELWAQSIASGLHRVPGMRFVI